MVGLQGKVKSGAGRTCARCGKQMPVGGGTTIRLVCETCESVAESSARPSLSDSGVMFASIAMGAGLLAFICFCLVIVRLAT